MRARLAEACAAALLCLSLCAPARAVFTKSELDTIDTERLFDSKYFVNLRSFAYPVEWQDLWLSSASGYRLNAASLDCCDLMLDQELAFRRRLVDGLTFKYRLVQQDDKDLQDFHQWVELEQELGGGFSADLFGEPTFHKEDSDIGLGLTWRSRRLTIGARHDFVDFNFNERGSSSQRYGRKPHTDQFALVYSAGSSVLSASLELDYPLSLDIPAQQLEFSYRRTTAALYWRSAPPGAWSRRLEYRCQLQDKRNFFQPDPGLQSLDARRQTHEARVALEGPLGERDRLELGQALIERAARADAPDAPQASVFYRRWEAQPYARWRRRAEAWLETELAAFLSFGEDRRRFPGNPAASRFSDVVEAKLGAGLDFLFSPSARIGVNATFDVAAPDIWGGGNVRAMLLF